MGKSTISMAMASSSQTVNVYQAGYIKPYEPGENEGMTFASQSEGVVTLSFNDHNHDSNNSSNGNNHLKKTVIRTVIGNFI